MTCVRFRKPSPNEPSDLCVRLIRAVPDGHYSDRIELDGFDQPLQIAVKVTVAGDRIVVDYDGTSPQVPKGINSVLNYTRAFTQYAMKCLLAPDSPNNDGSFAPIEVRAPEASIVHAKFPAAGRRPPSCWPLHSLRDLRRDGRGLPRRVVADSSVLSAVTLNGADDDGSLTYSPSSAVARHGSARRQGRHCDATAFPSNVANVPVEVMEQSVPILMTHPRADRGLVRQRDLSRRRRAADRIDCCGPRSPASVSCMVERTESAPRGFGGGGAGSAAQVLLDGAPIDPKQSHRSLPASLSFSKRQAAAATEPSSKGTDHAKESY